VLTYTRRDGDAGHEGEDYDALDDQ
jgi:hypothetical protein